MSTWKNGHGKITPVSEVWRCRTTNQQCHNNAIATYTMSQMKLLHNRTAYKYGNSIILAHFIHLLSLFGFRTTVYSKQHPNDKKRHTRNRRNPPKQQLFEVEYCPLMQHLSQPDAIWRSRGFWSDELCWKENIRSGQNIQESNGCLCGTDQKIVRNYLQNVLIYYCRLACLLQSFQSAGYCKSINKTHVSKLKFLKYPIYADFFSFRVQGAVILYCLHCCGKQRHRQFSTIAIFRMIFWGGCLHNGF